MDIFSIILFFAYCVLAYWAVDKIWYSKRTYIVHDSIKFYGTKMIVAYCLGWAAIPIAIIMVILKK